MSWPGVWDRLVLTTPPRLKGDEQRTTHLVWERR